MGLFSKLKGELVDIIEWIDDTNGQTLVWRFPRHQNEIKNGAQLIVRPAQQAVFVNEGRIADVFTEGRHELTTANLPILTTLKGWKHGFNSPFKCEVYFVSTKIIGPLKWGTPNPLMMRDPDFGAIRLGAFGTYTLRCVDAKLLLKELVGTDGVYDTEEINEVMRSIIQSSFATVLGQNKVPALDLLSSYETFADSVRKQVATQVDDEYGLEIPQLKIVNINVPEGVQKALDQRASMGALGSSTLGAAPNMAAFQQYQMGNAFTTPGGGANAGMNLGMGVAMAGQMMNQQQQQPSMTPPPPLPTAQQWFFGVNGQNVGPLTVDVAKQFVQMGQIKADTLAWTNGMGAWTPASQIAALSALFGGGSPPPLPGGGPPPMPS